MGKPLPTTLGSALDSPLVTRAVSELYRDLGSEVNVLGVRGEILRRRTILYTVGLGGTPVSSARLFGKVYESRTLCEEGMQALRWLWTQGFGRRPPADVVVPRALASVPELSLLILEPASGRSLKRLLRDGRARASDMRLFAHALIKLHGFPAIYGRPFTLDDHLERRCAGMRGPLASACPELSRSIERILAVAREVLDRLHPGALTLCHGDYHPGQLHVGDDLQWLVDLDGLHHGDPAYDVAMAVLTVKGLGIDLGSELESDLLLHAFLSSYFSRMDAAIARRVPIHAALIFVKRACKRFRLRNGSAWQEQISEQIRRGEQCLALHEAGPRSADLTAAIELCAACPAVG